MTEEDRPLGVPSIETRPVADDVIIPDNIIEPKFAEFGGYSIDKQIDIFCNERCDNPNEAIETILERCGISEDQYYEMKAQSSFRRVMMKKSEQVNVVMNIPSIHCSIVEDAKNGDSQAQKLALQIVDGLTPDVTIIHNKMLEGMDNEQLLRRVSDMKLQLEDYDKQAE